MAGAGQRRSSKGLRIATSSRWVCCFFFFEKEREREKESEKESEKERKSDEKRKTERCTCIIRL